MKLKDFLKSLEKYDSEVEITVINHNRTHGELDRCDVVIQHRLVSVEPIDHWGIFKIVKDNSSLKQVIVIY